jgi:GntR family transcriptional regulator, transcriptional repressor for pyruvate dehydrogenase complex
VPIQPICRTSLVDTVVERLQTFVAEADLRAGDRLPSEMELTRQLGVSRPVLREAVSRLESIGLLTIQRGRGMFLGDRESLSSCVKLVRSAMTIAPRDVLQYAELRAGIEIQAARLAAERRTDVDLAELEDIWRRMDADGVEHLESIRLDVRFHSKIVEITRNELMQNVMEVIHDFVLAGMIHTTPAPRNHVRSRAMHGSILDAIRSGDADLAEAMMKAHMNTVPSALRAAEERRKAAENG